MYSVATDTPGAAIFNFLPAGACRGCRRGVAGGPTEPTAIHSHRAAVLAESSVLPLHVWSGDVAARWDDLRDQISAGLNLGLAGVPNWTHDIGGFAVEERYSKELPGAGAEWREAVPSLVPVRRLQPAVPKSR